MIDDPWFYAAAVPAVLLAAINKAGFASGLGVLSVPLLALTVPPLQAAAILLPVMCAMDAFAVWAYRSRFDPVNLRILVPAGVIGVGAGWLTAGLLSSQGIKFLVGTIAVWFTVHYWLGPRRARPGPPRRATGAACGAIAAYTSFLAHAGGPPLSMYLLPQRLAPALYVGTSVMYWAAINLLKLVPYAALGQFDARNLLTSAVLLPLAPLGVRIGVWANRALDPLWFYRVCYALTFAVGAKLAWDGAGAWLGAR